MTVEIIGIVGAKDVSEPAAIQAVLSWMSNYLMRFAQAHEEAGFDRVLVGWPFRTSRWRPASQGGSFRIIRLPDRPDSRSRHGSARCTTSVCGPA
jgi:hypothetical protein